VGQIGVPAPPPDRGRWYAGAIGASSPHGPSRSTDPTQAGTRRLASESRQRHDLEWTMTARGLRAVPIGLGREGRREPTVRVAKLRGGLPRLPTAIQR
jgi:hypothetical protein